VKAVYALYSDPNDVQRAVDGLRKAGIADDDITVISSEPIEDYEFSHRHHETWIHWIAGAGGAIGLALGTGLTSFTQRAWPIPTGNMPIVAWWPNLIIMFEMTMLGAIVATVITVLVAARIPTRAPKMYDPEVADGKILVGVENPSEGSASAIERALMSPGVARLKTIQL
jgi:ActD protein